MCKIEIIFPSSIGKKNKRLVLTKQIVDEIQYVPATQCPEGLDHCNDMNCGDTPLHDRLKVISPQFMNKRKYFL